jgi:hypothetical protein
MLADPLLGDVMCKLGVFGKNAPMVAREKVLRLNITMACRE